MGKTLKSVTTYTISPEMKPCVTAAGAGRVESTACPREGLLQV